MTATPKARVTVLFEPEHFAALEEYCRTLGYKKSTLIARLVREHLASVGFSPQVELTLTRKGVSE